LARLRKLDVPVSYFGQSGFDSFKLKSRKELKLKILRSMGSLSMKKGGNALKDQDKRNSSQKDEVAKTGWSSFRF
jgi:hypothetical protein